MSHLSKQTQRRFSIPPIGISRNEGVIRDQVWVGNFIKQLLGNMGKGLFGISSNNSVVGEHVGVLGLVEGVAGGGETAAFGVEEDEMVGKIGGRRDEGLEIECMEGFAGEEVSFGYACFQKLAKVLQRI